MNQEPPSASLEIPPVIEPRRGKVLLYLAVALFLAAGAAVVFFFNPSQHSFYPRCLLYVTTGIQCPGCGSLRAIHALLHGQIEQAFRLNPLLFVLLPMLGWMAARELAPLFGGGRNLPKVFDRPFWVWLLVAVIILFTILRNLPFGPFAWLKAA